jgi:hypothetical protein
MENPATSDPTSLTIPDISPPGMNGGSYLY